MSCFSRRVNVPPYCGVPRLSHQFPVVVVVVTSVVTGVVVDDEVDMVVGDDFVVEVGVDVVFEVGVDVVQEASSIAAAIKTLKLNQINLFFNLLLLFN